mmetsp:Transcript_10841/g.35931  ORF Transcript_10841/g.35931 Transcript_10841/m.35931 type:complete len:215 (+) Transcript_10841:148-792(+)|eukprot:scaffold33934_cov129-Isochrysis_galbana.AAC.3
MLGRGRTGRCPRDKIQMCRKILVFLTLDFGSAAIGHILGDVRCKHDQIQDEHEKMHSKEVSCARVAFGWRGEAAAAPTRRARGDHRLLNPADSGDSDGENGAKQSHRLHKVGCMAEKWGAAPAEEGCKHLFRQAEHEDRERYRQHDKDGGDDRCPLSPLVVRSEECQSRGIGLVSKNPAVDREVDQAVGAEPRVEEARKRDPHSGDIVFPRGCG